LQIIFDLEGTLIDGAERTSFNGVSDLLEILAADGHTLYLWTGAHRSVKPLLVELGLTSYFRDFCFCDIPYPKPDARGPAGLLDFNLREKALVVGDSRYDLVGAQNLGADFVAACWSDPDIERRLKELGATMFAHTPNDILNFVES